MTGSPGESQEEQPVTVEQNHAAAARTLHKLSWTLEAPLVLMPRDRGRQQWSLTQAGLPVAVVDDTTEKWLLSMFGDHWTAAVRHRDGGCHLEVSRVGWKEPVLYYDEALLAGGEFVFADRRFKLGCRPVGRAIWTLARTDGEKLARIEAWAKQPYKGPRAANRLGLFAAAKSEPDMRLLLATCSMAIAIQCRNAHVGGPAF
jgi:hypothetical protein